MALLLYRNLLQYAKRIDPPEESKRAINQIRTAFRTPPPSSDDAVIQALLKEGQSRLEYLKMVTPRMAKKGKISTKLVYRDGKVVEDAAEPPKYRDFIDRRVDEADLQRHFKLLRRQYFLEPPPEHKPYT